MRRSQESDEEKFRKYVKLGEDNLVCIQSMTDWCKHVEIKLEASGLYAEWTGLPIGSHSIACPYVRGGWHSMHLRRIFSNFLDQNCASCSHHEPNGNTSWGQNIIDEFHENKCKQEEIVKQEAIRISTLLRSLRSQAQHISVNTEHESQKIVMFLERVFSENTEERQKAAEYLKNSARLAAELFTKEAINLILELAISNEFAELLLPVCAELASTRTDLTESFKKVALDNIERHSYTELSAYLLVRLNNSVIYPLEEICIRHLLLSQNHYRSTDYRKGEKNNYIHSTTVLIRCFDESPNSLEAVMRNELQNKDEILRIQACSSLALIQQHRPQLVLNLLKDLMQSLELYEHSSMDAPSKHIIPILGVAFRFNAKFVDSFLDNAMERVRPTIQEDIIRVYRAQFFDKTQTIGHEYQEFSERTQITIQRLLIWIKDDRLEIDIRNDILEVLEIACQRTTAGIIEQFDALLGYYALICQQDEPPKAPPKILLLNELHKKEKLESINNDLRKQQWQIFKRRLDTCLEHLCESDASTTFNSISDCLNHPLEQLDERFKAVCVSLLGVIGKNYQFQPHVLPLIWRTLMDHSSNLVRATSIDAITDMFRYSNAKPPENLIEILIISLTDRFVIIHQAALRTISVNYHWFDEKQSVNIVSILSNHLKYYKTDEYQLKEICKTILGVSNKKNHILEEIAYHLVKSVFPIGIESVDQDIIKTLMYFSKQNKSIMQSVAKDVALFLARYDRDSMNWYGHSRRGNMFTWLHELPLETYQLVANDILKCAKKLALKDAWESCHFASFFAHYRAFEYEAIVLEIAANALPKELRHESFKVTLQQLANIAKANAALQRGDIKNAASYFAQ